MATQDTYIEPPLKSVEYQGVIHAFHDRRFYSNAFTYCGMYEPTGDPEKPRDTWPVYATRPISEVTCPACVAAMADVAAEYQRRQAQTPR